MNGVRFSLFACLLGLGACGGVPEGDDDNTAPTLEITGPERGVIAAQAQLIVTGRAFDDTSEEVTVDINGQVVDVDLGGNFTTVLNLTPGLTLLDITATDASGNSTSDSRAVLHGEFRDSAQDVEEAAMIRLNASTLAAMGGTLDTLLSAIDVNAIIAGQEFDGSCSRTRIDSFSHSGLSITLQEQAGGVGFTASVLNMEVHGNKRTACIGADFVATADSVDVSGQLEFEIDDGAIVATVSSQPSAEFQNLDVDGGLLVDIFNGSARGAVRDAVRDTVRSELPIAATTMMSTVTGERTMRFFDTDITANYTAEDIEFNSTGGIIILSAGADSPAGNQWGYFGSNGSLPEPATRPRDDELHLAVAANFLNQVGAAVWSSRAMHTNILLDDGEFDTLLGVDVDRIAIEPLLPPIIYQDPDTGVLTLAIGDVLADVMELETERSAAGIAVSVQVDLLIQTDPQTGLLTLSTGATDMTFNITEPGVLGTSPLTTGDRQAVSEAMQLAVDRLVADFVGSLTLPTITGLEAENVSLEYVENYLFFTGDLLNQ